MTDLKIYFVEKPNLDEDDVKYSFVDYFSIPVGIGGYSTFCDILGVKHEEYEEDEYTDSDLRVFKSYVFDKEILMSYLETVKVLDYIYKEVKNFNSEYNYICIQKF